MSKGIEGQGGWNRGAETKMIHTETAGRSPELLIARLKQAAYEAVEHSRLVAVLHGEESTSFIAQNKNPERQLEMARMLLNQTPFIKKYMPPQFDELEQAAYIVNVAKGMEEVKQQLN
jgi:hypothetical protein